LVGEAMRRQALAELHDFELPEFQQLSDEQRSQLKATLALILQTPKTA
jgi:hypothetical protein